jgi:hypothetical protein
MCEQSFYTGKRKAKLKLAVRPSTEKNALEKHTNNTCLFLKLLFERYCKLFLVRTEIALD